MNIPISHSAMTPIYEQIAIHIRQQIRDGQLKSGEALPSVRTLARDCRISALTAKKAYDTLEEEGFVTVIQGKGTYVAEISECTVREEMQKQLEQAFLRAIEQARQMNLSSDDIENLVRLLLEEYR